MYIMKWPAETCKQKRMHCIKTYIHICRYVLQIRKNYLSGSMSGNLWTFEPFWEYRPLQNGTTQDRIFWLHRWRAVSSGQPVKHWLLSFSILLRTWVGTRRSGNVLDLNFELENILNFSLVVVCFVFFSTYRQKQGDYLAPPL